MYLWRCSIAVTLGLIWYFHDFGRCLIQSLVCLICFLIPTHDLRNNWYESSTQTDELPVETPCPQATEEEYFPCHDEYDAVDIKEEVPQEGQYPNVKRSLQQVFECAYSQLILTWYNVPEPRDSQPLHGALAREFDQLVERVIRRTRDFNVCAVGVGCVRILTQHLRNARHSDRGQLFSSREDEMAVLRTYSAALVRNLFPASLLGQNLTHCALNEIVALKALELLVNWLSDPDNLNQLVVSHLDSITTQSLQSSMDELQEPKREATPSSLESEDTGQILEGTEDSQVNNIKPKKKGNKFREGLSKIFDKVKLKEHKKKKRSQTDMEVMFRALKITASPFMMDENRAGSVPSLHESDSFDSELERDLRVPEEIEFKLSYEMWRVSSWVASVTHVEEENEELCFTIHLEEKNNPEKLNWDVRKTQSDIRQFLCGLQDATNLPSISELVESTERIMNDEFKEEASTALMAFLQVLVSDSQLGQSQAAFQFLCPLERLLNEEEPGAGVWGLLSSLANFLTPGQEEEEEISPQGLEKQDETISEGLVAGNGEPGSEGCHNEDSFFRCAGFLTEACEDNGSLESVSNVHSEKVPNAEENVVLMHSDDSGVEFRMLGDEPSISACGLNESGDVGKAGIPTALHNPASETHSSQDGPPHYDSVDGGPLPFMLKSNKKDKLFPKIHNKKGKDHGCVGKTEEQREQDPNKKEINQSGKEQQEATKAILDLLKEVSGNSILVNICDAILKPFMPLLKRKVNRFLVKMNPTESQMASYIDILREKQWPRGSPAVPGPCRTKEQKKETKERAHQLINTRYSNALILKKTDVEAVFKLFQDAEENKKLVYMLLSFLLRELMPGESALNVKPIAVLNSPV